MSHRWLRSFPASLLALALVLRVLPAVAQDPEATASGEPVNLKYAMTMPAGYDAEKSYPAVLALPPGPQTEQMVDLAHQAYWDFAEQRGWIVVSPVAPEGRLFFDGAEALIPALLEDIRKRFKVEGNAFHVAGISNGGIAAFRVAENDPALFCSLFALPGLPGNDADFERLDRLAAIPVEMVVGEDDARWAERMGKTEARLRELGSPVALSVLPGVGHVIAQSFTAPELFDKLDAQRPACKEKASAGKAGARGEPKASEAP